MCHCQCIFRVETKFEKKKKNDRVGGGAVGPDRDVSKKRIKGWSLPEIYIQFRLFLDITASPCLRKLGNQAQEMVARKQKYEGRGCQIGEIIWGCQVDAISAFMREEKHLRQWNYRRDRVGCSVTCYKEGSFVRLIVREECQSLARRTLLVTTHQPPLWTWSTTGEIALRETSETDGKRASQG